MPIELKNVRILDLSRVLAGPLCSMMLGDLGADVIKVERPGQGDESRGWGPPFDEDGESAYYLSCNRNKLSIALDLDKSADRDVLAELMEEADVVLENFRPARSPAEESTPGPGSNRSRNSSGARSPDSGRGAIDPAMTLWSRRKAAGCRSPESPTAIL